MTFVLINSNIFLLLFYQVELNTTGRTASHVFCPWVRITDWDSLAVGRQLVAVTLWLSSGFSRTIVHV